MRNVIAIVTLIMLPLTVAAAEGLFLPDRMVRSGGGVFPNQPVPMSEGYGKNGSGNHYGVPQGSPSEDCVVNPVSMRRGIKETVTTRLVVGDVISVASTILFDFDKDTIRPQGVEAIRDVYDLLVKSGITQLSLTGHTDSKGTEEYNDALGFRRSAAVALTLQSFGFENVDIASAGELEPTAPNTFEDGTDDPTGREKNRRVDIEIMALNEGVYEETSVGIIDRNPQIFHVLSAGNIVRCGWGAEDRTALWWSNGPRHNSFLRNNYR